MTEKTTNKRRRGRPPLKPGEAKRASFNTRLREGLKRDLEQSANKVGRSLSEEIEFRLERSLEVDQALDGSWLSDIFHFIARNIRSRARGGIDVTDRHAVFFDIVDVIRQGIAASEAIVASIENPETSPAEREKNLPKLPWVLLEMLNVGPPELVKKIMALMKKHNIMTASLPPRSQGGPV